MRMLEVPMPDFGSLGFCFLTLLLLLTMPASAPAAVGLPPSFVPQMDLSYIDPHTGEVVSCGEGCRRFEVPDGVELEIRIRVQNNSRDDWGEGAAWDLWFDQRYHPFPGVDLNACHDVSEDRLDIDCWLALYDRVDWDAWARLVADLVCVPEKPDECVDVTIWVPMDLEFDGSRGRGVYSLAVWVDRFGVMSEDDEFDNFVGPVRVKVVQRKRGELEVKSSASSPTPAGLVTTASSPRPYSVRIVAAEVDMGFTLSSQVGRTNLEFSPSYSGAVTVEVEQVGVWEKMTLKVRKVSTGEILAEISGKGRLLLEGMIEKAHLKDDRQFEVVVQAEHGTRGLRGTISVSYPSRAVYRRTQ
jgi:hypothetical protein